MIITTAIRTAVNMSLLPHHSLLATAASGFAGDDLWLVDSFNELLVVCFWNVHASRLSGEAMNRGHALTFDGTRAIG